MGRIEALLRLAFAVGVSLAALAATATACDDPANCPRKMKMVHGNKVRVGAALVTSWAKLNPGKELRVVGVTIPMSVIENPPVAPGDAPHGGFMVSFPEAVRATTFFDHFEMHWNPQGHEPALFQAPHFDFHFYAIPMEDVRTITAIDPEPPAPQYLPQGFIYPGQATFLPEMGVHVLRPEIMDQPFSAVMLGGIHKGRMHFLEPMITRERLMKRQSFAMEIPRPETLGRATLFPGSCEVRYDAGANAYHIVFRDFSRMS